jgi:hypothetical protein
MAINNHVVNTNGRGANAFSNTFHGLRRTQDGKLYYTLRDKNVGTFSNDGGTTELSSDADYVAVEEQYISGKNQTFAGDGSDTTFTLTTPVLDGTRIAVFLNGVKQPIDEVWTYASSVVTFKVAPYNGSQVAIGYINKKYKNNTSDLYHQYLFEDGDATYFIDDNGYFVKRENKSRGATALSSDDFNTAESSTYPVASTSWQSAV